MDVAVGKSKWLRVSTLAASIAMLVSACGTSAPSTSEVKNGGTLIFALDSDATTLNPFVMSTVPEFRALSFMYPNLYAADKNLNVIPDLADGMPSVSSDGTVWTVKLKKTGKWSDGTPMTADDVLATQKLQADPTLDTDYSYDWSPLKTIEKVDTYTVRYTLNAPFAPFLAVNLAGYIAPASVFSKAKAASNVVVHTYEDLGYIDFRMNTRKGHIFDNVLTRQALASVLDKASIVQAATQGAGAPLWGDIVPASWAYDANSVVKYPLDVAKAKSLMQQAGWTIGADGVATRPNPNGGGTQKFVGKIRVRAGKPDRLKAAEIIADQVKQIGMQLTPDPTDFKVFYKPVQTGNFDVIIAGFSLTLEPDDYSTAHSSQLQPEHHEGQNWTGYSNPQLDSLIDQERATVKATDAETKAARKAIFNQIEKIISGDVQTYMLWADVSSMGWTTNVGDVVAGSGDNTIYYDSNNNPASRAQWYSKSGK